MAQQLKAFHALQENLGSIPTNGFFWKLIHTYIQINNKSFFFNCKIFQNTNSIAIVWKQNRTYSKTVSDIKTYLQKMMRFIYGPSYPPFHILKPSQ